MASNAEHGDNRSPSAVASLCAAFVEQLPITGASISMFATNGLQSTLCASDSVAARSEALQFELGEGPHWEAIGSRAPVLCSDIRVGTTAWPLYAHAAAELGVVGSFAFPMIMGAAVVGVVDLYTRTPFVLDSVLVDRAGALAQATTASAMRRATQLADDPVAQEAALAPALRREVHQATGMILVQLGISATDAFARLRAYSFASGRPVTDIARDVVERRLDFASLPD
jgi:hypothetical protein